MSRRVREVDHLGDDVRTLRQIVDGLHERHVGVREDRDGVAREPIVEELLQLVAVGKAGSERLNRTGLDAEPMKGLPFRRCRWRERPDDESIGRDLAQIDERPGPDEGLPAELRAVCHDAGIPRLSDGSAL